MELNSSQTENLPTKNVKNWSFGDSLVRTVLIENEPWFVGKDVATVLEYANPLEAVREHVDEDDKGVSKTLTPGGVQETIIINESGLYSLIFSSKMEKAKEFKRWVTHEVLPSIRKTGSYTLDSNPELSKKKEELRLKQIEKHMYILDHLTELSEKQVRSFTKLLNAENAGENSPFAFTDEDSRVSNFINETCKVTDQGFVKAADLYACYEKWCDGAHLSKNTFVRRVQKILGKLVDYKQKRIAGSVELVFAGLEFLEN